MNALERMNVGVVGVGRGMCLRQGLEHGGVLQVRAACDLRQEQLDAVKEKYGVTALYTDYEAMLDKEDLDVVVVATPMPLHVPQSVAALDRDIHVISEVTAAISLEQCRELVDACKRSRATYLFSENAHYVKENRLVTELVRHGLFGTPYYGEGEYLHALHDQAKRKEWRRKWTFGVRGVTYGTHELGPFLAWMQGERVTRVAYAGSGRWFRDAEGVLYENDASNLMLCEMTHGGLCKVRMDTQSPRPASTVNFALQGTEGCYESARWKGGTHRVWLASRAQDAETWTNLADLEDEFLPPIYHSDTAHELYRTNPHRGSDFFTGAALAEMLVGKRPITLGVHEAMDMTLPGLMSQVSAAEDGRWVEVPDSRAW